MNTTQRLIHTRCELCGSRFAILSLEHLVGGRAACDDCRQRLSDDLCPECHGTGYSVEANRPCSSCGGEGVKPGAGCIYAGRAACDHVDTCLPCRERAMLDAVDRAEALREAV